MTIERELPSRLVFRDPLEILLAEEQKTCKGCAHEHTEKLWGVKVSTCRKRRKHGSRCKKYHNPQEAA